MHFVLVGRQKLCYPTSVIKNSCSSLLSTVKFILQVYRYTAPVCIIIHLFELIMIRDAVYKQFSVIDDGNVLNIDEVKSIIYFICTT